MQEYTKDQLWKIYDMLPEELKTAVFAQETADNISFACKMAGINDSRVSGVAKQTGYVLMGLLHPNDFAKNLEIELQLPPETAKKISHQINRLIFNPVKESLAALFQETFAMPEQNPDAKSPFPRKSSWLPKEEPQSKDTYREPISEE